MGAPLNRFHVLSANYDHPEWTANQIAEHLGCRLGWVRDVLKSKKTAPAKRGRPPKHRSQEKCT